jgi:Lipocalin-like domain
MTARSRWVIAGSALAALVGGAVLWFAVIREKPKPQPADQPKTTAELLVGTWRLVEQPEDREPREPDLFGIVRQFADDGRVEDRVTDFINGPQVSSGTYRLEGNTLKFFSPSIANPSPTRHEIWELTSTIESLTEEELVIVTVTRKRWAPERAQQLAGLREVPVEQVLAEVREDRSQSVYIRVKDR